MPKDWWKSKTIWINLLALAGSFLVTGGVVDPSKWTDLSAQIILLANIILRFDTDSPIGKK